MNGTLLDSNRLLNLKARYGLAISNSSSTSLYIYSRKLEKLLDEKIKDIITNKMDRMIFIGKIIEKMNDIELITTTTDYLTNSDINSFISEASKIKSFLMKMRKLSENDSSESETDLLD